MKTGKLRILLLSVMVALGADKKAPFRPDEIDSYANKQKAQNLTVAAKAYDDPEDAKKAFGKLNPYEHGVLPVLVIIRNDGPTAIKLDGMQTIYMASRGRKVESTPAADVMYLQGGARPKLSTSPIPTGGIRVKVPKSKLRDEVITERAFSAKMLPPGDTAHGFVYFQTGHTKGTSLYLAGLLEAGTGRALLYFEVPFD